MTAINKLQAMYPQFKQHPDGTKVIKGANWELHLDKDGKFKRLLPPPEWLAELSNLITDKKLSHAAARTVIETWQTDTLNHIAKIIKIIHEPTIPS